MTTTNSDRENASNINLATAQRLNRILAAASPDRVDIAFSDFCQWAEEPCRADVVCAELYRVMDNNLSALPAPVQWAQNTVDGLSGPGLLLLDTILAAREGEYLPLFLDRVVAFDGDIAFVVQGLAELAVVTSVLREHP